MYMTASIIQLFNTGYSHLSLKIGTVLAGLLTLPFIYLLGKEVGSKRIGLLAFVFAGIAYWPNVISRVGLRFPLYPLFVAPVLYFLLRGIRTSNRNDFILSGLFLGIGLHGYTPIRILPVVILVAVGLYLIHAQSRQVRKQTVWQLVILAVVALFVFLPLLRYATINPEGFSFRSFSRLGTVERPLPGAAGQIFLENLWNALTMFAWDNGEIWVVSVTHCPALDVISAALFFSGVVLLFVRYLRKRHWLDLFLLLSVPLLMLPSILSLAYPAENPALNRLSGAMVTMFLIVGIALDGLMSSLSTRLGPALGPKVASVLAVGCILLASLQNYGLVFNEYQRVFEQSAWNTSEMGEVIRQFTTSVGSEDTAWVLAYPHWVDTRLVGMNAGYPLKDYAIWPENLPETTAERRAKLFLVKPEDAQGLQALQSIYPQGVLQEYVSEVDFHNFLMFFVPPAN
jgi:4-amino-4-deoxy-L-arabinose transferase-like glycosyltransferase